MGGSRPPSPLAPVPPDARPMAKTAIVSGAPPAPPGGTDFLHGGLTSLMGGSRPHPPWRPPSPLAPPSPWRPHPPDALRAEPPGWIE
jgi:hypothetical protein